MKNKYFLNLFLIIYLIIYLIIIYEKYYNFIDFVYSNIDIKV